MRLGKTLNGPNAVVVSTNYGAPTTGALVLGHSRVAHGLERERSGDERYQPAAPGAARQSAARIFRARKDFLERGIKNNPDRPELYEALARLYKEKYKDHERAAEYYAKAATLPEAAPWDRRFSAYELSYCEGREREHMSACAASTIRARRNGCRR